MRPVVCLACVLWASLAVGGELVESKWGEPLNREVGSTSFSGDVVAVTPIGASDGLTVAYVDLYGTASQMDLMYRVLDETGKATSKYGTVASSQPTDLGNGWTRFAFRGLGMRTEMQEGPRGWYGKFGDGAGIFAAFYNGRYPVLEGMEIDLSSGFPSRTDAILYDTAIRDGYGFPEGVPTFNVTRETLDPPFGDASGDSRIDINDFGLIKNGFGQSTTPYVGGDVTGNLAVDLTDYGILKQNFGWRQSAAVPEPSAFGLLGVGVAVLAVKAGRRRYLHVRGRPLS